MNIRKNEIVYSCPARDTMMYLDWKYTPASGNKLSYSSVITRIGFYIRLWHEIMDNHRPDEEGLLDMQANMWEHRL